MFSEALISLYGVVHGRWHWPGAGYLIRRCAPWIRGLQSYPLQVPGVGVALLDFRDLTAFGLLNHLLGDGTDLSLLRTLEKLLKPGDVFWDIGANVGLVASHFANPRFKLRSIHAFEPNPAPFKSLQSLFGNHPCGSAHPFGLGEKDENLKMSLSTAQGSAVGTTARDFNENRHIEVQIRNGDAVRRDLQLHCPSLIKIDVEGSEPQVLRGLKETIAECRPIIVFEHIFLSDDQINQIAPVNYSLYFIHDDGTLSTDASSRLKGHDAIFIPLEKSHLLDEGAAELAQPLRNG